MSHAFRLGPKARQRHVAPLLVLGLLLLLAIGLRPAAAQDAPPPPLLTGGDGVITGFSGVVEQAGKPFIDLDGPAAKVMALSRTGPAYGQLEVPPVRREIPAREVGQVFGIAIDNMVPANVYLGATAAFGLRITTPDADGDGVPEIALKGQPDAQWMQGQWGPGGGPGSIWKVDGATGVVELFATLPNSGPGLGNIAYDPFRYQLFVSNLDDGLIYRLDLNGNIIDTYDHGTTGRAAAGLPPVADDGSKADITSPDFSVENTNTWGLTDIRRQVWGLAVHGDRLYYAVATGPEGGAQIWSVGINVDGSLAADTRVEIAAVPGGLPVSDMLFTPTGRLVVAQRGMFLNSLDNSRFHIPGADRVLRYHRDPKTGQWVQEPREYAVGFPRPHRNASGGVALSCAGRLWVSGDQLRNDPEVVPDAPFVVHGLQRMHQRLVKPRNEPPFRAVFVDYDGTFGDVRNAGHIGDVEVYRDCVGWPRPPRGWLPPAGWTPPDLFKEGLQCVRDAETGDLLCDYAIYAYNWRKKPRTGGMIFYDIPAAGVSFDALLGATLSVGGNLGFSCSQPGGPGTKIKCESSGSFSLDFGAFVELRLRTRIPAASIAVELPAGEEAWKIPALANCVAWEPDGTPGACTYDDPPRLKDPWPLPRKDLLGCTKADDGSHECAMLLTFRNVGAGTFTGTATITDEVGPGVVLTGDLDGFDTDGITLLGWTCAQPGGAGTPIECRTDAPVSVGSGEQVDVLITVRIPAGAGPESFRDCAVIGEHGPKACADAKKPPRLVPGKERRECRKTGDVIVCEYLFRIRNDGIGVHDGPLTITDAVGPNATLITTDAAGNTPDGTVTWTCAQPGGAGNPITCTSDDPVRLDPGEEAEVGMIAIRYPADAKPEDIADCAFIEEGGPKACLPGNIEKPKLDLGKALRGCRREGGKWVCTFTITITNTGGGAWNGPLSFSDDVGPATSYVSHTPAAGWTCSQTGGGADIDCASSGSVSLPAGGSVSVNLTTSTPLGLPDDLYGGYYKDCAVLKVEGHEGRECVNVPPPSDDGTPPAGPPGHSDHMDMEKALKECRKTSGPAGDAWQCTYTITITRRAPGTWTGQLSVRDDVGPDVSLVPPPGGSVAWNCTQSGTGADIQCATAGNVTLNMNDTATLEITTSVPLAGAQSEENRTDCALLKLQDGELRRCLTVDAPPSSQPRLKVRKEGLGCRRDDAGAVCRWRVTVTNIGDAPYNGKVWLGEEFIGGESLVAVSPESAWDCAPGDECISANALDIAPGGSVSVVFTIRHPASTIGDEAVRNCVVGELLNRAKNKAPTGKGMQAKRRDPQNRDCAEQSVPEQPRQVCPSGTQTFRKGAQVPQNYTVVRTFKDGTRCARFSQVGGTFTPPVPPVVNPGGSPPRCRAHERTITTRREAKKFAVSGWKVRRVETNGAVLWCASRPTAPRCKDGWQPVRGSELRALRKKGWRFYAIRRNGRVVQWCGKPPARKNWCRSGGRVETNGDRAEALRRQGWNVDFVREPGPEGAPYWCVYGRTQCPNGWTLLSKEQAKHRDAQGWRIRVINGVYCGKPGQAQPSTCPQGYQPVNPGYVAALRKRGWSLRRIARNRWCGKQPDTATDGGPRCIGGTLKGGQCICPRGKKPKLVSSPLTHVPRGGIGRVYRCVSDQTQSSRDKCRRPAFRSGNTCACPQGYQRRVLAKLSNGRVIGCVRVDPPSCPKGMQRVRGRCVPRIIIDPCPPGMVRRGTRCVRIGLPPCPQGMKRIGGRCVRIQRPVEPRPCPKGTVRARNGRCMPVRIDPNVLRELGRNNARPRPQKQPQLRVQGRIQQRLAPQLVRCGKGYVLRNGRCVPNVRLY